MNSLINPDDDDIKNKIDKNLDILFDIDVDINKEIDENIERFVKFSEKINRVYDKDNLRDFIKENYKLYIFDKLRERYEIDLKQYKDNTGKIMKLNNEFISNYLYDVKLANYSLKSYQDIISQFPRHFYINDYYSRQNFYITYLIKHLDDYYYDEIENLESSIDKLENNYEFIESSIEELENNYEYLNNSIEDIKKDNELKNNSIKQIKKDYEFLNNSIKDNYELINNSIIDNSNNYKYLIRYIKDIKEENKILRFFLVINFSLLLVILNIFDLRI